MKKATFNKIISLIIAVLMIVSFNQTSFARELETIQRFPDYKTYGDFEYVILEDGTVAITSYTGNATDIVIPSFILSRKVTEVYSINSAVKRLTIPATVDQLYYDGESEYIDGIGSGLIEELNYCSSLQEIIVDKNNPYYSSLDGVLFDKERTAMYVYPAGKKNTTYNIPEGVECVYAIFSQCRSIENITVPASVFYI